MSEKNHKKMTELIMNDKHEEASRLFDKIEEILEVESWESKKVKVIELLRKYYDPKPELVVGEWVDCEALNDKWNPCCYINDLTLLNIRGSQSSRILAITIKPHTFTESDLELLNTDKVKYELSENYTNGGYAVKIKDSKSGSSAYTLIFSTIHEAIREAFNQVLGANLLKQAVKK